MKNGVPVQTQLAEGLPLIQGDRVQLQQVILNLILNAVQAMSGVTERTRELLISTGQEASGAVLVTVQDSGPGFSPESFDRVFDPFYTTKANGMGMGLDLPVDRRCARGSNMGIAHCWRGHRRSVHSLDTRQTCAISTSRYYSC
jgi:C4-dicarboxylate-specific signal transduction histidine kinase